MHSRIMGILTKENYNKLAKENNGVIPMPDFTCFDRLPGWADYVDDDVNFEDDFKWFCEFLNKDSDYFEYNPDTHVIKFTKGFKEQYFEKRFDELKDLLNSENGLKNFCSYDTSYTLKNLIEDETGFLVTDDYGDCMNLDQFIRYLNHNEEYVVFGSLDYHW